MSELKVALLNVGGINNDPYEYGLGFFETPIMENVGEELSLNDSIKKLFSGTFSDILSGLKKMK
tara:strand:+ start:6884 stop:7075 length:192 start_codon:yes stop_codon:yes gene_type:complete